MIDWKYLIKKYGGKETPHKFEEIALAYVQDVYPQYSWYPTKKTRDGNKDAQRKEVYFGKDNSFDVWEEAKFRGTGRTLRRQDIDPTILSGLIQGNVRLIIFVTNAPIPDELMNRAVLGARLKGIKVSCVMAAQLESWLATHPKVYNKYWDIPINNSQPGFHIVSIQTTSFFDMVSNDFKPFCTRKLIYTGNICLLTVSILSNIKTEAKLLPTDDFPFEQIQHPNYDDPEHLIVEQGLSTFALLLKARTPYSGGVNLCFQIENSLYFKVTSEIEIIANPQVNIVYAQQLEIANQIKSYIEGLPKGSSGDIITIIAQSGMGKSFLLNGIYEHFGLKRDMTIVDFESDNNALTNYLLLCRVVLFLCYGNIFWGRETWSPKEYKNQKSLALQINDRTLFSDDLLSRLFDGSFDANIAKDTIEMLSKRRGRHRSTVPTRNTFSGKILLLDDFQYLNGVQQNFIYQILDDLTLYHSNCVIILSAAKDRFPDRKAEKRFLSLSPNLFELKGLTYRDMATTLSSTFQFPSQALRQAAIKMLSPSPLLTSELLRAIRETPEIKATDNPFERISAYSKGLEKTLILKNRFGGITKQYYLLDAIYRFKKGIPVRLLTGFSGFHDRAVKADLDILITRALIVLAEDIVYPYHDSYVRSYTQLRKGKYCNSLTGRFLSYLLERPDCADHFDTNQLLAMLIACGKGFARLYENKIKKLIQHYMDATQFGAALHYCSYFYKAIKDRNPVTYTKEEFRYLFFYAYCLVHCGDQELADQLLEMICTFAGDDVPEKFSAGSELLSQRFWAIDPDGLVERSFIIQNGAKYMLGTKSLSGNALNRVEQAYDTCFNRRMAVFLLLDQLECGQETYAERLRLLAHEYQGDKFRSHAATLIMDYARGISYFAPLRAERLLKIAMNYFSCQAEIHYRRILLCEIDYLLIRCVNGDVTSFYQMSPLIDKLLQGGFSSEYFKAVLKHCACKLVFASQVSTHSPQKSIVFSRRISSVNDDIDEITNALLESGLNPGVRDRFLLNQLMAYYSIQNKEWNKAQKYLQETEVYVRKAGKSYQNIVAHNLRNMNTITRIAWCTKGIPFTQDTFLLDCRFW